MTELEQLKQELERLTGIVAELENENKEEKRYPKVGQDYYYCHYSWSEKTTVVERDTWKGYNVDYFRWQHLYGSLSRYETAWEIEHAKLISKIKDCTSPYDYKAPKYRFAKRFISEDETTLELEYNGRTDYNSEYGYFATEIEGCKFIERFGKEYILNFLFRPIDGNYELVISWLNVHGETSLS